jgi:hypothetical protein
MPRYAGVVTLPRSGPMGEFDLDERLCTALICGVPVIAPQSPTLAQVSAHRKDLQTYDPKYLDASGPAVRVTRGFTGEPATPDLALMNELSSTRLMLDIVRPDITAASTRASVWVPPAQRTPEVIS